MWSLRERGEVRDNESHKSTKLELVCSFTSNAGGENVNKTRI
jgi:hypothetical protein